MIDLNPLRELLGSSGLLESASDIEAFGQDWTRIRTVDALAVALPGSTAQVQGIVRWALANQVSLVPSGGRTGLSGGAVASRGELVVAMDRMNRLLDIDQGDATLRCEAGMVTGQVQRLARDAGLFYPVDFASADSSQIGGNVATNAGGIQVIRYGMTRDQVLGLKVVTGTGDVLDLNRGLIKNATGYDLRHLFVGSEGTLGIITEVTLQLTRPPAERQVLLLALSGLDALAPVLSDFRSALTLTAFEFFTDIALSHVLARHDLSAPFTEPAPCYALLEFDAGPGSQQDSAFGCFEKGMEQGWIRDGVMSQSEQQAIELWHLREWISESISRYQPYKNDIAVTPGRITEFLRAISDLVSHEYPDLELVWFGHIGDGNLHLNILQPAELSRQEFLARCEAVSPKVFDCVARFNGSISAEHGVGLLKKPYLTYSRSDQEIAIMRGIKAVLDPAGIMNPGKIFDATD